MAQSLLTTLSLCLFISFAQEALASSHGALFKYIDSDGDPILASEPQLRYPAEVYRSRFRKIIKSAAKKYHLNADLLEAVIHCESGWHIQAVSPKGAQGLMQLMPETAKIWGVENSFNPQENILGGARYLRHLMNLFDNNLTLSLAAYHAGENRVIRQGGMPKIASTKKYVELVLKTYGELQLKVVD